MSKKKLSIGLNTLIVIFEIIGLFVVYKASNRLNLEYYTEDSNILALVSSLLFVVFLLIGKKIPKWLQMFKYITTICLAITFFVVIFVLAPMYNFDYGYLLFKDGLLYHHLICPLLAIGTFLFCDEIDSLSIKDNIFGLSMTILYGIVLITLNIFDVVEGPYPFLMVKKQSVWLSIMWIIIIDGLAYLLALLLRKIKNSINQKV